ncbi:translocation/assembly module TamB domain-containing protein [Roseovarius dicentrarchi]|uniref:translocation/assembly module TamB domain-containing protein n=1 Tax=Roseovarius dicentrarchi TaxID=2250573 RepID=UPI0019395035|nr:translocation/assembly module TamB domain-containing protein [Roseovarius dicentrarchi]
MTHLMTAKLKQVALMLLMAVLPLAAAAQDDRGLLQGFIEDNLSTEGRAVRIEGFAGALSSEATLELLTIADEDGIWLTLKDVTLNWSRLALLRGRLEVTKLSAGEILVPRFPKPQQSVDIPDAEATGFSLPDLPVAINVEEVAANRIVLGAPLLGEEVSLSLAGSLQLDDGVGNAKLDVTRLDRSSDKVALDVRYSNADHQLGVDLTVTEDAGGLASRLMGIPGAPPLKLTVLGDDPLEDFTAEIALETDGEQRIGGTVAVQSPAPDPAAPDAPTPLQFSVDIGGDIAPVFAPEYRAFFGREIALTVRGSKPADGGLGIDVLSLKSAALTLDGTLQLGADNWPRSFDLTGRLASANGDAVLLPLSGPKTTLDGADLKLRFDHETGDEWRLTLDATGLVRDDLTLDAAQISGGGTLAKGEGAAPGRVDGALDLAATGLALTDPDLKAALGDALNGDIVFDWTQGTPFRLSSLSVNGQDFSVEGSAEIAGLSKPMAPRLSASVAVKAADLGRFAGLAGADLQGATDVQIDVVTTPMDGEIEVSVSGTAQDLAVGQPRLDPLLTGRTQLRLDARRGKDGTFLDTARVTSANVDLDASAAWKSAGSTADLMLKLVDTAVIAPGLSGPATLRLDADQAGDVWTISAGASGPGEAVMTANGTIDVVGGKPGLFDGRASIVATDFSRYSALAGRDLGGAASVVIDARGNAADLSGQAELQMNGQDLAIGIEAADRILRGASSLRIDAERSADGALTLSKGIITTPQLDATAQGFYASDGAGTATVDLAGDDLSIGIAQVDRLLRGKSSAHVEALRSADGGITLRAGRLNTPQIDATANGFLAANGAARASVDVTGNNIAIGIAQVDSLLRGRSTLNAEVARDADGTLVIDSAALRTPQVTADVSGTLGTGGNSTARIDARVSNVALLAPGISGPGTIKGTVRGDGSGYVIDTDATGPAGITAKITGRIGNDRNLNLQARGKVPLALANFAISPRSLSGIANFDLAVNGPPAVSSVTGTITTSGAGLALPKLKLALQGINANVRLTGGAAQIDASAGVSTGGRLAVNGRIGLSGGYQADLAADLQGVGITDPGLYTTKANGRITLNGPLTGGANIAGTINLGKVSIQVPSGAITAGANLPGLEHINEPAAVRRTRAFADMLNGGGNGGPGTEASGPVFGLDVTVNAPARIFVRGRGLDAELGGALRLRGNTAQVIPEGRFNLLRGRLDILGKRLDLTEGYLQMQGSFVPYLHLVAQTTSGDVQIIIGIDGPATEPEITFSSQPDLPEDQVVSQLIFGRDLSQISAFQAIQLASAVATLAGKGGGGVVGKLRQGVGLDNLDVTTGAEGNTEVKAGKYLSENIYSEVEVDSEGETQINLNLQINKRLKAKGSFGAGGNSGLGVFFEKDY